MATITPIFIEKTIKNPDTILNCEEMGLSVYIKQIDNLGQLLVAATKEPNGVYDIKCFDWITSFKCKF